MLENIPDSGHNVFHVYRIGRWKFRPSEIQEVSQNYTKTSGFFQNDSREFSDFGHIGVSLFGQNFRRRPDYSEGVSDFMGYGRNHLSDRRKFF